MIARGLRGMLFSSIVVVSGMPLAWSACPVADSNGIATFPDGTLGMSKALNVNPDGAALSYTVGNHGFTYVVNGVDLWRDGPLCEKNPASCRISCQKNIKECNEKWKSAEEKGFEKGTAEFYSYAIEGESISGKPLKAVDGGYIVGNGLGRPKIAGRTETATGKAIDYYRSMTSLMHRVDGKPAYLDSSTVPTLVAPRSSGRYLGNVALLTSKETGISVFAIVGDTGEKWGESSIALHQMLRYQKLIPQLPGPIEVSDRCSVAETQLSAPFESRPDGDSDRCRAGFKPKTGADIRAYVNFNRPVVTLVLGNARLPMSGQVIADEVTAASLAEAAERAGYTAERLADLAKCVPSPQ